jgi:hypothetical protein
MSNTDPFLILVVLAEIVALVLVGAALLWIWDRISDAVLRQANLDRCLTCRKLLRYRPETHDYERHRCRPRY